MPSRNTRLTLSIASVLLPFLLFFYPSWMLSFLSRAARQTVAEPFIELKNPSNIRNMSQAKIPLFYHAKPEDSWHGTVDSSPECPFQPEKGRYHLYVGLFCPFAHRANIVRHLKGLQDYIDVSIVKPYPKGDENGWPGWQFPADDNEYPNATVDKLFGSKYLHEVYFKADKNYKGRYSVPVLWDKKLETIVNNESAELLRSLQTSFNSVLSPELADLTLYPAHLRDQIDETAEWMQRDLNTGVYKAGFATDQESYEKNLPPVFAALNKLEKMLFEHKGPYVLGKHMTELDVRLYATLIRFDPVYVQHFKCNLGTIRYTYPVLHNWLKGMYWNHEAFRNTTDFKHIKENYTKSHYDINPKAITPMGPYPDIEEGYESDWSKLSAGSVDMPAVLEAERKLDESLKSGKGASVL